MINYKQDLNSEQLDIVQNADGPCLVLAGAGSGKTRVITYRVAYLLEQGVKPENILLVTFTNKAAREMVDRVAVLCRDVACHVSTSFQLPWSGTFHHIAFKILKKYVQLLGYQNDFTILDSEDSLNLIKLCLKQEGIDRKERRFPSPSVLEDIISFARNSERTIEDVLDLKHPHFLPILDTIVRLAEDYQKRKLEANMMDFDDLLVNWHLLLRTTPQPPFDKGGNHHSFPPLIRGGAGGVLAKYAEQFKYILVDEYQDTNKIQASIIDMLASVHKNILVVGDDAQSIYSFRAAEIKNILDFEKKYPSAKIFRLETNYRSTPDILNLANGIISRNLNQYEKNLKSVHENFAKPVSVKAAPGKPEVCNFANSLEEAEFIAQRAKELIDEGTPASEISVLFRAAHHSQMLEMELMKRGIAYDYRGGVRFFERAHIKDALAYLRIINNPEDVVAWRRVLNMQIGIGSIMTEKIIEYVRNYEKCEITKYENIGAQLPAKAQIGWSDFLQIWRKLNCVRGGKPGDMIAELLDSKYAEYLENEYPDYRERIQDIEQLAVFAENYDDPSASSPRPELGSKAGQVLNDFLAESALHEGFRSVRVNGRSPQHDDNKIILSTIHQAKGLEWEAVFVINLAEGQFPNSLAMREQGGLEEERRLFYVAVTRAKKHLCLSYPLLTISNSLQGPSMFLEEIDADLVQDSLFGGENSFDNEEIVYEDEDEISNKKRGGFLREVDDL